MSKNWDGTGLHPVLKKTAEEIKDMNISVTDRHAGDNVDSADSKPQPSYDEQVGLQTRRVQENQNTFIDNLANGLSERKS